MLAYMISDLTKAWKATEIKFYVQAPPSLQAPVISNMMISHPYNVLSLQMIGEQISIDGKMMVFLN